MTQVSLPSAHRLASLSTATVGRRRPRSLTGTVARTSRGRIPAQGAAHTASVDASAGSGATSLVESAATVYRQLAQIDPDTYLPDLARALTHLGKLRAQGNWERALPSAREATEIYRQLTRSDPRALPDVAGGLSGLLWFLTEMASCPSTSACGEV